MNSKEEWRAIPGYTNYEVSNMGQVRLVVHERMRKPGLLNITVSSNGYHWVCFGGKTWAVHRVVLWAFVGMPSSKSVCNHKNGIKDDNRLENLEWITSKQNTDHAIRTGVFDIQGENHPATHLTEKDICTIRLLKGIMTYKEIGEIYNVSYGAIVAIVQHRTWKHVK